MLVKLWLSAGITVFITAVVAVVVQQTLNAPPVVHELTPVATATVIMPTATPPATPRPVVDAETVQQREATFQARLAAANAAIAASAAELAAAKQAQAALASKYNALAQQEQQLQKQAQQVVMITATPVAAAVAAPVVTTAPAYMAMDSALAAIQAVNPAAKLLQSPDMVMYENTVAYEFIFDMGTVYVTATDGALLYDGIAVNARAVADARGRRNPPPSGDTPPPPGNGGDDGRHHHHHDDDNSEDGSDD